MRRIHTLAAVIGGLLMLAGVFVPMLSVPLLRDRSYFELSRSGAVIILVLSALSILIALLGRYRLLYVTGLLALGLLTYSYFKLQSRKASAQSDLKERVIDSPFKNFSEGLVSSIGLRLGWPMMMLGAGIFVAVPLVGSQLVRRNSSGN